MILYYLIIFSAITGSINVILSTVGTNIYDIRQVKKRRKQKLHPSAARYRRRPLVSVIVPTNNDESVIMQCLQSLLKSNYRKLEIIIADNSSTDNTKKIVREYIAHNPNKKIKLYAKRKSGVSNDALSNAYKYYAHGEIVILLGNAKCTVDKYSISKIVMHFNTDDDLGILSVNNKVRSEYKTAELFQEFGLLLRNRAKKSSSVFNVDYFADTKGSVAYSSAIFSKYERNKLTHSPIFHLGNRVVRTAYASDVAVYGEAQSFFGLAKTYYNSQLRRLYLIVAGRSITFSNSQKYTRFLAWFYLPFVFVFGLVSLAVPVLLTYFTFLAVILHEPTLLIFSWAAMGIFLLFAIWEDEQLRLPAKARYVALIPITFGWFYLMSFVQYLVVLTSYRAKRS